MYIKEQLKKHKQILIILCVAIAIYVILDAFFFHTLINFPNGIMEI